MGVKESVRQLSLYAHENVKLLCLRRFKKCISIYSCVGRNQVLEQLSVENFFAV
jgi:hypothetical protein